MPVPARESNKAMNFPAFVCVRTARDNQMTIRRHRGVTQRKVTVAGNRDLYGGLVFIFVVEFHAWRARVNVNQVISFPIAASFAEGRIVGGRAVGSWQVGPLTSARLGAPVLCCAARSATANVGSSNTKPEWPFIAPLRAMRFALILSTAIVTRFRSRGV